MNSRNNRLKISSRFFSIIKENKQIFFVNFINFLSVIAKVMPHNGYAIKLMLKSGLKFNFELMF